MQLTGNDFGQVNYILSQFPWQSKDKFPYSGLIFTWYASGWSHCFLNYWNSLTPVGKQHPFSSHPQIHSWDPPICWWGKIGRINAWNNTGLLRSGKGGKWGQLCSIHILECSPYIDSYKFCEQIHVVESLYVNSQLCLLKVFR